MLIRNRKSGAESFITPENWEMFKTKEHPTDRTKKYASMFEVVDATATQKKGEVPKELKVFNGPGNKEKEAEEK